MITGVIQMMRFGAVGATGMAIDFAATWLCKEKLQMNKFAANSIGFCLAVINNYLLNRWWTFESHDEQVTLQFGKFIFVSIIGLALNNLLLYIFTNRLRFHFYRSKLAVIGLVFFWNYFANTFITFR
jgi:putative flippase GtrA